MPNDLERGDAWSNHSVVPRGQHHPALLRSTGGVPDLWTERRKMPTSPASDPSTGSGLLWTGTSAGRAPAGNCHKIWGRAAANMTRVGSFFAKTGTGRGK